MDPAPPAGSNFGRGLQRGRIIMQVVRIGLDLAKYVFEVHGVDGQGNGVIRKTLRRGSVSTFFANLPPCLVGMEASNGAHYWARVLTELGHKVRLISPQFVARREPRWIFACFHLNGAQTLAYAMPVHTPGSGSNGVTVSPSPVTRAGGDG